MARSHFNRSGHKPTRRSTKAAMRSRAAKCKACPSCSSGDAVHDTTAWRRSAHLITQQHCEICGMTCDRCGRHALEIWTELINWGDGGDSMSTTIIPIPENRWANIMAMRTESEIRMFLRHMGPCSHMIRIVSDGKTGDWRWKTSEPFIFPHD